MIERHPPLPSPFPYRQPPPVREREKKSPATIQKNKPITRILINKSLPPKASATLPPPPPPSSCPSSPSCLRLPLLPLLPLLRRQPPPTGAFGHGRRAARRHARGRGRRSHSGPAVRRPSGEAASPPRSHLDSSLGVSRPNYEAVPVSE